MRDAEKPNAQLRLVPAAAGSLGLPAVDASPQLADDGKVVVVGFDADTGAMRSASLRRLAPSLRRIAPSPVGAGLDAESVDLLMTVPLSLPL